MFGIVNMLAVGCLEHLFLDEEYPGVPRAAAALVSSHGLFPLFRSKIRLARESHGPHLASVAVDVAWLAGPIPKEIGGLTLLWTLWLERNQLSGE